MDMTAHRQSLTVTCRMSTSSLHALCAVQAVLLGHVHGYCSPMPEAFSLEDGVPLSGTDSLLKFSCRQCFEVKCLDTAPFAGRCITGANAVSVIVQITDICPECAADHLDIQALTYNKLSPMDTGRINIQYR